MSGAPPAAPQNAAAGGPGPSGTLETPFPAAQTLINAARIAQQMDRPIMLDYYADSYLKKAFIGEDPDTKEKVIVKNNEEFTSLISKVLKVGDDYLVLTENSIYIVSMKIEKRKLATSKLLQSI
jgi:SepF-like predicted cell division protein (DUF552 family)